MTGLTTPESPGETIGENAAQLQWGSENVKTLSSRGPRKCVRMKALKVEESALSQLPTPLFDSTLNAPHLSPSLSYR